MDSLDLSKSTDSAIPASIRALSDKGNFTSADPMLDPKKRLLMMRLIIAMLVYIKEQEYIAHKTEQPPLIEPNYFPYFESDDEASELQDLIAALELREKLNEMLLELHTSLNEGQSIALEKLATAAATNPAIAALQPQLTKAIETAYSPETVTRFMSIQNGHPTALSLLHKVHPAFHSHIQADHASMVRARARHDPQQAAHHAARICHHIAYGQQFYVEPERKRTRWVEGHDRNINTFARSGEYQTWTEDLAKRLAAAAILKRVFPARSAQRYHTSINPFNTWPNAERSNPFEELTKSFGFTR